MTDLTPRRVLVIAYYFPPMGLSGVQRTLKFVKYFPRFQWHPTVLTVEPVAYYAYDESLLQDIDAAEITVVRTKAAGPGRLFAREGTVQLPSEPTRKFMSRLSDSVFIPDNKVGWRKKAVAQALELHRTTPFDLVFATAPPFTDFLIGQDIKKRIRKPLVFDYRDPWIEYPFKFYPTPLHKMAHISMERKALRASSHVITTNRRVKELLIKRHSFLTYRDIDIIPQGFDPADFAEQPRGTRRSTDRMRITYAGVFWEDRTPETFLQALHELCLEHPELRSKIEARFVGKFRKENSVLVERLGLADCVTTVPYLPHRECIRELLDSDVLWMTVGDDVGSPGKTYEYIGARKPILGLVPPGFLEQTIRECGGTTVRPKDVRGVKQALAEYYQLFQAGRLKGPPEEVVEKYNRVNLTGALVRVFESLFEA